jgi:putative peptidoglycan lipid II flippase
VVGKEVPPAEEELRPPESPDGAGPGPVDSPAAFDEARPDDSPQALVRHSAVMSVGTGLSRVTGFMRLAAMAFALGVTESRLADAFNVANVTPNIVYDLALGGIISAVFIPVFVERLTSRGREAAWHTARTVLTVALVVLTTVMVLGIVFSDAIVHLYTLRVEGPEAEAERQLASFFLKWFMPQIVLYALGAGVATGLLNAHRTFGPPMFAPILNNLVGIATFLVFAALPGPESPTPATITTAQRYVLAVGTTLGVLAMTVALWPFLRRLGFRFRWTMDLRDAGFRRIVRLSGWALVYVVANQLGLIVVIVLATAEQGGYTAYAAAFVFFQLPYAIFAVSIMTALLPALATKWTERDVGAVRSQVVLGIRGTAFIVAPAALGYLALATPIVRLLLQHGVMGADSTELVARLLQLFSLGMFSFCAFQLLLRAFYAMQDTRTPALINVAAVAINTLANLIYYRYLGVEGLALGHATAYTFAAVTAAVILHRRLGGLERRTLLPALGQIGLAGLACGAAAYVVSRWIGEAVPPSTLGPQLLQVAAGMVAGGAAFVAVAAAFRLQELTLIRGLFGARTGRG